ELHDVPLVDEGDALSPELHRVTDRAVNQTLGADAADRLEADADSDLQISLRRADRFELRLPGRERLGVAEADLLELLRKLLGEEVEDLLRFRRPARVLDAGVDVFRVLAEDHHVDFLGMSHRRRYALVPADGPQTHVQVEQLSKRDVQRSDAAANRRRQRT